MAEAQVVNVQRACIECGKVKVFKLDAFRYDMWKLGHISIQRAFPELSADDRELLLSGFCGECYDKIFAEDEDE